MRLALICACLAGPAAADLTFCNRTDIGATVAIAYSENGVWVSEGWWRVEPGQCRPVVRAALAKQFYYWRAISGTRVLVDGAYRFCTSDDAFTIQGEADCEARGYQSAAFREEEVAGMADFTVTMTDPGGAPAPDPAPDPAPAAQPVDAGPGTFGEPYTIVAEFRGCWAVQEERECEFFLEGWHYVASETGPTDLAIIDALEGMSEGTRMQVSGDMISYAGDRAEITIRSFQPVSAPPTSAPPVSSVSIDGLMEHLQGYWNSDAGDGYAWVVKDNFLREIYDGNIMRESFFEIAPTCAASDGQGPVIIAWPEPNEGDGPECYVVTETAQRHLAVRDVTAGTVFSFSYSE